MVQENDVSKDESFTLNTKQTIANQFAMNDDNENKTLLLEKMKTALSRQNKGETIQLQELNEL